MLSALLVCLLVPSVNPPALPPDAVIVAPREFLPALNPLIEYRQKQGRRFAYVPTNPRPEEIRTAIRNIARGGELKFVLIVGDAEPAARTNPAIAARCVPTQLIPAAINVKYGSEPQIASDNWYADLDDDNLPDIAIGRIPADSPAELTRIVTKILAYERNNDFGAWRQRVNFIAGVGGFSPLLDTVIETATSKLLTSGIPPTYDTSMTYGSWRSPYCPDPRLFHATTVERHNEGCLFWVYIGHGQTTELDKVRIPGERFHILNVNDCGKMRAKSGAPIAIMLACYTAAFDQPQDCLAEQLLKADGGPVAVYGGSRVTMPYAMGVMGTAMMHEYFQEHRPTLGETILAAKRKTMARIDDPENPVGLNRMLLDGVAAMMSPNKSELEGERREHLHIFNLLGDPMLTLAHPQEVDLTAAAEAQPGQRIRITGKSPLAGKGVIELVCRRDCQKTDLPIRDRYDPTDKALAAYQSVYEQTLDRCWARWAVELPSGDFATEIIVPVSSRGPCHLRLTVANPTTYALGTTNLNVSSVPVETAQSPVIKSR
ncbi:MAG TPA: C25 family cysteine peptidase [Pirellulaceae bacterium]|jgi:hypothetical protein